MTLASVVIDSATSSPCSRIPLAVLQFLIQRMRVRLADHTDAGPAGMAEDLGARLRSLEQRVQERIAADGGSQCADVVAQFTHLGSHLVDEAEQVGLDVSHRLVREVRNRRALRDFRFQLGQECGEVASHEQVQAGGVATADLESVE